MLFPTSNMEETEGTSDTQSFFFDDGFDFTTATEFSTHPLTQFQPSQHEYTGLNADVPWLQEPRPESSPISLFRLPARYVGMQDMAWDPASQQPFDEVVQDSPWIPILQQQGQPDENIQEPTWFLTPQQQFNQDFQTEFLVADQPEQTPQNVPLNSTIRKELQRLPL